ncbi:hypothetical protein Dimus_015153 [Dionaea muscipula]
MITMPPPPPPSPKSPRKSDPNNYYNAASQSPSFSLLRRPTDNEEMALASSPSVRDLGSGSVAGGGASVTPLKTPSVSCSLKRKRPPSIQIPDVLREIRTEVQLTKSTGSPAKDNDVFCFRDLGVGVSAVKGKKKFMEDTHKIVSSFHGNHKKGFFGVYDGHGGRWAADYVAENLYTNIMTTLEDRSGNASKDEAVRAAYLKTDEEFLKQGVGSGACCVTALIEEKEMVISNLGDCRAVLCRGGVAEALTKDHKPDREDERKRIEDTGGYVEMHRGAWRVHGTLAVSRSIGDSHLKDWILAEPETRTLNLTSDMEFLVLASDGLWDKVGNQEAIDIVLGQHSVERKQLGAGDDDSSKENNIVEDYACVSSSCASPKVRRISLVKQQQERRRRITTCLSPRFKKTIHYSREDQEAVGDFDGGNESPPAKCRRISLFHQRNTNTRQPTAACKELVNLAVGRGSLDDVTVIIIDLSYFRDYILI